MKNLLLALCALTTIAFGTSSRLAAQDTVKVKFDDPFPIRLIWSQGEKKGVTELPGELTLPVGKVNVTVESHFGPGTYAATIVRYNVNGEKTKLISDSHDLVLKKGDAVEVIVLSIVPPSNSGVVPFKDGQLMVTLIFPSAISNKEAKFTGAEEFRSSALFIAKYGWDGVAARLAKYAKANFGAASKTRGNLRNNQQVAVLFQTRNGKLLPGQQGASEIEIAEAIEVALRMIALQTSFGEEVTKAKGLLGDK